MDDFQGWATAVGAVIEEQLGTHVTSEVDSERAVWLGPANRGVATPHADGIRVIVRYDRGPEAYFAADQNVTETGALIVKRLFFGA